MTDKIAAIKERYEKLANGPLGMSSPWERKASNGKPLLYGGKRGLLAYGTIATWDEFDLIADVINALPELLNRIDTMEKALEPFAEIADSFDFEGREMADDVPIYTNTAGDYRRARAAIAPRSELDSKEVLK